MILSPSLSGERLAPLPTQVSSKEFLREERCKGKRVGKKGQEPNSSKSAIIGFGWHSKLSHPDDIQNHKTSTYKGLEARGFSPIKKKK